MLNFERLLCRVKCPYLVVPVHILLARGGSNLYVDRLHEKKSMK